MPSPAGTLFPSSSLTRHLRAGLLNAVASRLDLPGALPLFVSHFVSHFPGFLPGLAGIELLSSKRSSIMRRALSSLRNVAGNGALVLLAGGLVLGGYVLLTSLDDVRRYIKISTM